MRPKDPGDDREPDGFDDITRSILDGSHVDWTRADTTPGLDVATVRALRDLERITGFSRELQETQLAPEEPHPLAASETKRWGDLTLLELIGTGARGEVWRAWDPTLQRDVALKFLQPSVQAAGREARTALLDEARALARVRHPAVVTVYGIAEHDGQVGMWMEYLRGSTLAQEIERQGSLSAKEVARIGSEISAALQVVHSAGLVHRDIKPANIMVEHDGRVVLTDFGLGMRPELIDRTLPRSSGTPIFMSPEVLAGNQATPQSDLYALGVTLLWALTGRRPFQAETLGELKKEISVGPSSTIESARRTSPRGLVHAIEWAIRPNPGARPRSASDLAAHFLRALDRINLVRERRRWTKAAVLPLAVLGIAAIVVALIVRHITLDHALRGTPSIAVLPLANLSGDPAQDYFSDGMTEELIARLAQVGKLQVISYSSVTPFKHSKQPLHEIARALRVRMLVEGAVMRYGDRIRVSARLVDVRTGRGIWGEIYERDGHSVFAIQSDIARAVVQRIEARLTPREKRRLDRAPLVNPEAHAFYLHGLAAFREQTAPGVRRAIALYQRAVALDSNYVDPWVGLAYAYDYGLTVSVISRSEGNANARAAAHRALQLDPESGPARAILGTLQLWSDWNFVAAERSYREALALSPGNAEARAELVILLVTQGRFDEAIVEAKRAREADPLSSMAATVSLFPLFEGRRYSEAIRAGREILIKKPNFPSVMLVVGQALFYSGKRQEGIAMLERTTELDPTPAPIGWLGLMYGLAGKKEKAIEIRNKLNRMAQKEWVDPYFFAIVDVGLGERARALDYIERAGYAHSPEAVFLRVDPALDPLRSEPRFQVLLESLGMVG